MIHALNIADSVRQTEKIERGKMLAEAKTLSFELKRESELLWRQYENAWFPCDEREAMIALMSHFLAGASLMLYSLEAENLPLARSCGSLDCKP